MTVELGAGRDSLRSGATRLLYVVARDQFRVSGKLQVCTRTHSQISLRHNMAGAQFAAVTQVHSGHRNEAGQRLVELQKESLQRDPNSDQEE